MASKGLRIGIEAKIEYNPILDILGNKYESIRRTGLNDMQRGMSEAEIEKSYQSRFNLQWAWADSIATEVKQTYSQLTTAKKLNIARIKEQIKKKIKKAKVIFKSLSKVRKTTIRQQNQALGLKSKLLKIQSLKNDLKKLESTERLHICFGSKKLFNAQYYLEENGYSSHEEWLHDWQKKRGGRFYCVGKSVAGGGTMIKIFHQGGDDFKAVITLPRFLQSSYGQTLEIPFQVNECRRHRKSSLLYALDKEKPITVQIFRREHKIESLDFSKKKASMSEASSAYNSMLSNLSTAMFREALTSRCRRYGIGLHLVNPAFTSVIGMIKFMPRYGLNSGTAAAMTIARRAMGMSERAPVCLVRPEDRSRHPWTTWNRVARYLKNKKIRRSQLFDWKNTLEKILVSSYSNEMASRLSFVSNQSNSNQGKSPCPNPKQNCEYVQLCLGFK